MVGQLLALALVMGLLAGAEMWHSRHEATVSAEQSASTLVRLLAEQTERTVQAIDFTLIAMRDGLRAVPTPPLNDPVYRAVLNERLRDLPYVRALFVIGPDGFITHDTGYPTTPMVNLADRSYFRAHQEDPEIGLHIAEPLRSRSVGSWFVSFSRRVTDADGSFGGVVVAAVEPGYFKSFYERLGIGEGSLIALLLRDGTLLARVPNHEVAIGMSFAESPARKNALVRGSGVTWSTSPIDATTRIVGYQTLVGGSLIVVAGWTKSKIYGAWELHALIVGGGSILVWTLIAGLTLLWHQTRRREQAEQARLAQARRLEMTGRIAGGIAHDLGNTIKIARTTFTLLRPSLTTQREAMALVDDADHSLKSAFDIIDRLLGFARQQELRPRPTDVAPLIYGFAPILRQAVCPRVQLELDLAKHVVCRIDPIHLESALLNLVLNSKDAIPDTGHVRIELRAVRAPRDGSSRRGHQAEALPWAQIVVKDDGAGMSSDVVERAFEPFFTTKAGGTGLGLSQILGFVQQSAGEVRIESREGYGTTVTLLFPTTSDPPEPADVPSPPHGRNEPQTD
jgi:signal transduction histidine kinase